MALLVNNPNTTGTATADLIFPYNGTGVAATVNAGDGNDTVFGNRLAAWVSMGNANQTYTTPFSIDDTIGWTVGGTANPTVGDPSIPNTTVYAQSVGGGYFCYSINLAANATMTLDIDAARSSGTGYFDSYVEVLNASTGAVIAQFDDGASTAGGLGSVTGTDSFGTFTAGAAGTYIIRVGRYASPTSSQALQDGDMFALTVSATGHAASFGATGGNETFNGEGGDDYLVGYIGQDTLNGGDGNDALYGFTNSDTLNGGAGNDILDGGDGYDFADYTDAAAGVTVDLRLSAQDTIGAGADTLTGIESIYGSDADDTLTGTDQMNTLFGNGGNDTLKGLGGDDFIYAGLNSDTVDGGDGNDTLVLTQALGDWTIRAATGVATGAVAGAVNFSNIEYIQAGGGSDTIYSDGSGVFSGGGGDDTIYAANGSNERLNGEDGIDTLDTTSFNGLYIINMATGATNFAGEAFVNFENLIAGNGANTITGTAAANSIRTGSGSDTINAGDGNDIVEGGGGNDTLDGQNDFDIASYEHAGGGVTVSLLLQGGAQDTGGAGSDTLSRFEGLRGSAQGDTLTGDDLSNTLIGGGGNDSLVGNAGDDTFVWAEGDGNDEIDGGDDYDTLDLRGATSGWTIDLNIGGGSNGADALSLVSIEQVDGSDSADRIIMSDDGGSIVNGFGGDDYVTFGRNSPNAADGGDGVDTLDVSSFGDAGATYTIDLAGGGSGFGETLLNFENLVSGGTDDTVTGTDGANDIRTGDGTDTIRAGLGDDVLAGGAGDDILDGGDGSDTASYAEAGGPVKVSLAIARYQDTLGAGSDKLTGIENLIGSGGDDQLTGNRFDNRLDGGAGKDMLNGGKGADTMAGGAGNDQYAVDDLGDSVIEDDSAGGYDTVKSRIDYVLGDNLEKLVLGAGGLSGTGNALDNLLVGGRGNNDLSGLDGDDTLDGGLGRDRLTGGAGADRFVFRLGDTGTTAQNADRIVDFSHADGDKIILNAIDADGVPPDSSFSFIGTNAFSGTAGELRYHFISGGDTLIEGDINGDGVADLAIRVVGQVTLVAGDFKL